jgi:hypothetical protein
MKKLRDPGKYPAYDTKTFATQASPGIKTVMYKGSIQGEKNEYPVYIQFRRVEFSEEEKPRFVPFEEVDRTGGKGLKFYEVPDLGKNDCALKCMCFPGDTLIPLLEGYSIPIKDLVGKDHFYVYSFDTDKRKIVIGKGYNCEIKEKNVSLIEVTLDNGNKLRCTPDHEFYLKSSLKKEAKDLLPGDSLQALYRRLCPEGRMQGYEQVLQEKVWGLTHRLADSYNLENNIYSKSLGSIRHHNNFNNRNNNPENIKRKTFHEHRKIHLERSKTWPTGLKIMNERVRELSAKGEHWLQSEEGKLRHGARQRDLAKIGKHPFQQEKVIDWLKSDEHKNIMSSIQSKKVEEGKHHFQSDWMREIVRESNRRRSLEARNHKVISVRRLEEKEDVYCFSVEKYGNFFIDVDGGIDISSGILVKNCSDFRFFWEHPLFVKKSLIGQFRKYVRKTTTYPPKNPQGILGMCKHLWSFVNALKEAKLVK